MQSINHRVMEGYRGMAMVEYGTSWYRLSPLERMVAVARVWAAMHCRMCMDEYEADVQAVVERGQRN